MTKGESNFKTEPCQNLQRIVNIKHQTPRIEDDEPLVGPEMITRVLTKNRAWEGFHVCNITSIYYRGVSAQCLSRFDRWTNPRGLSAAFKRARRNADATLGLTGNCARSS